MATEGVIWPRAGVQFADLRLGFVKSRRPAETWKVGQGWRRRSVTGWEVAGWTSWMLANLPERTFLVCLRDGGFAAVTRFSPHSSPLPPGVAAVRDLSDTDAAKTIFEHVRSDTGGSGVTRRCGEYGMDEEPDTLARMMARLVNRS